MILGSKKRHAGGKGDEASSATTTKTAGVEKTKTISKVDTDGDGEFNFFFKVDTMKLLDGTYDVVISSKNISHYKNKSSDIEYWIALEPESTYKV